MYVAKYNNTGTLIKVVKVVNAGTTTSYDSIGYAIAIDSKDNVYVTGSFYTTSTTRATFGSLTLKSRGGRDVFVAKLDTNLNFVKVFGGGTASSDYGWAIALDKNDNVFVTGYFGSSSSGATFGNKTLKSHGSTDAFVLKLNKDLVYQNAVNFGGNSGTDVGYSIVTDSQNNVYVGGIWQTGSTGASVLTFGRSTLKGNRDYDMFVAKFTNSLGFSKVATAKGSYREYLRGITIDKSDNLYITGYWSTNSTSNRTCTLGRYVLTNNSTSANTYDIFVAKLDKNLSFTRAINLGGSSSDYGTGIASDGTNVYLTGYMRSSIKVGSTTLPYRGSSDVFMIRFTNLLTPTLAKAAGGSSTEVGYGIAVDSSGNYYLTGHFFSGGVWGGKTFISRGSYDAVVTKNLP